MRATAFDVLAEATAVTVDDSAVDVTGALARILRGSVEALGVEAAAVLVTVDGGLELLAATTHRVADLEAFQLHVEEGPCIDAVASSREVLATHPGSLTGTWPRAGAAILRAGYTSVHAVPLLWRGRCYGALNAFGTAPRSPGDDVASRRLLAHAVTLVIAGSLLGPGSVREALQDALTDRGMLERAKGALAEARGLEMAEAYDALVELARDEGVGLGTAVRLVLERARDGVLSGS